MGMKDPYRGGMENVSLIMLTMYLDESGDHSLETVDPQYPVFVLGGVIVDDKEMDATIEPAFQELKRSFFGDETIILHTSEISRNLGPFTSVKDPNFRNHFFEALNELMETLPYMIVACAIRKDKLLEKYQERARNPYHYALHILVERFIMELSSRKESGSIVAEARDTAENRRLREVWDVITRSGTDYMSPDKISNYICSFSIKHKSMNLCGLQLADLIVSPIGRAVIGKKKRKDWEIISKKFRRKEKKAKGYGLIVLP